MKVFVLKKKCMYMLLCIVLLLIALSNNMDLNKSINTNASPITNKVVVLDAGHGLPDQGTVGISGSKEYELNLKITLKLQEIIEQSGAKVILTRSDDNGIYEVDKHSIRAKKISDMNKRVEFGNNSNADIFISIHMNYYTDSKYSGWQTFYNAKNVKSKHLANFIQTALNDNIEKKNRNPMAIKGVYIMDKVNIPTVIVECGFLSNANEEAKMKTDEYQNTLAWSIYIGIQKYFMEE